MRDSEWKLFGTHDFNNLLMVISGYTEVLLEQANASDSHYQGVLSIQQAADRATTLTRQLLAFSRKQLLELKVVDVNSIVEDMQALAATVADDKPFIDALKQLPSAAERTLHVGDRAIDEQQPERQE